jgi:hypothetical protein
VVLKLKFWTRTSIIKCPYALPLSKGSDVTKESKSGNVRDESTYAWKGDEINGLQLSISRPSATSEKIALEPVPQTLDGANSDSGTTENENHSPQQIVRQITQM